MLAKSIVNHPIIPWYKTLSPHYWYDPALPRKKWWSMISPSNADSPAHSRWSIYHPARTGSAFLGFTSQKTYIYIYYYIILYYIKKYILYCIVLYQTYYIFNIYLYIYIYIHLCMLCIYISYTYMYNIHICMIYEICIQYNAYNIYNIK